MGHISNISTHITDWSSYKRSRHRKACGLPALPIGHSLLSVWFRPTQQQEVAHSVCILHHSELTCVWSTAKQVGNAILLTCQPGVRRQEERHLRSTARRAAGTWTEGPKALGWLKALKLRKFRSGIKHVLLIAGWINCGRKLTTLWWIAQHWIT